MHTTGSIGGYFDVAQLVLYVFWIFFTGLIYYLLRENKREGYPLDSDRTERSGGRVKVLGFPAPPPPKTFHLYNGQNVVVPNPKPDQRPIAAEPLAGFPGAPLEPTGNPMLDGVGPGAYAERADQPDLTFEHDLKIVPMRIATDYSVPSARMDPRGKPVLGADHRSGGTVVDLWVDRAECILRYLEVETAAAGAESRRVLLPATFCIVKERQVMVDAILGRQFRDVPVLRHPDQITLLEEDRICAYYGGGTLYATPERQEPLL
jgi:photosynthetic reaction center H subunit